MPDEKSPARDDWDDFDRIAGEVEAETEARLAAARADASARGKEPFDLDRVLALYTPRDVARYSPPRDSLQRMYERQYYLTERETMTLEAFARMLASADQG